MRVRNEFMAVVPVAPREAHLDLGTCIVVMPMHGNDVEIVHVPQGPMRRLNARLARVRLDKIM